MPGGLTEGGIEAETRQTLENLRLSLDAASPSLSDEVGVNTFVRDVGRDFHAYSKAYQECFPEPAPTRTTAGAKTYGPILVEIECAAYALEG